jgi:hypothetical protein
VQEGLVWSHGLARHVMVTHADNVGKVRSYEKRLIRPTC